MYNGKWLLNKNIYYSFINNIDENLDKDNKDNKDIKIDNDAVLNNSTDTVTNTKEHVLN